MNLRSVNTVQKLERENRILRRELEGVNHLNKREIDSLDNRLREAAMESERHGFLLEDLEESILPLKKTLS